MRNNKEYNRIFVSQCRLQDKINSALVEKLYEASTEIKRLESELKFLKNQINAELEAF